MAKDNVPQTKLLGVERALNDARFRASDQPGLVWLLLTGSTYDEAAAVVQRYRRNHDDFESEPNEAIGALWATRLSLRFEGERVRQRRSRLRIVRGWTQTAANNNGAKERRGG